jgi:hypothetical protein
MDGTGTQGPASGRLDPKQTEGIRARVRLMIEITARAEKYRNGLLAAAEQLSREEATIVSDL